MIRTNIILFCLLFSIIGIHAFFFPATQARIKKSIAKYHSKKTQIGICKIIEYKPCSEFMPDSMRFFSASKKVSDFGSEALLLLNIGSQYFDSVKAQYSVALIDARQQMDVLSKKGAGKNAFTICKYSTTNKDTLCAILNEKLIVVWPD